ncbi:TlpA disulfide reductase family protein [Kribbella sp. NPDC048915]|uniref:TlpA family protein disulfide reductase n=1 Tax=Kribbella sp. NPDC048915 TaxID=3155148 RepID=UPI0033DCF632
MRSGTPLRRLRPLRAGAVALVLSATLAACGTDRPDDSAPGGGTPSSARSAVAGADQLEACPATPSKPPVGDGLPDVSLPCLGNGPDIRLADLRGPLVVNVWAQWCGPCRDEAPYLAQLAKSGKVSMLGIDYDDPRPEIAAEFAQTEGLAYPHVVDREKAVRAALKIAGPPLTAFVDADGKVVHIHRGVLTSQQQLDQLVKDKLGVTP